VRVPGEGREVVEVETGGGGVEGKMTGKMTNFIK
jgi:hypothetical protein